MSRALFSPSGLFSIASIACASSLCNASIAPRVIMHPDTEIIGFPVQQSQAIHEYTPVWVDLSTEQLMELRSMGADIDLIKSSETIPELSSSSFQTNPALDTGIIEHVLNASNYTSNYAASSEGNMRFSVGRNTTLNDGNIAGSSVSLPGDRNSISTMTQSEGEYNFYDMAVEWKAASTGKVDLSFTSGVTAIQANVSKRVQSGGTTTIYDATNRVIAVPTIGSSVRWKISNDWSLTGNATTQSLNMGSSLIGFNAQTDWRISDRIGLSAGYQILRSEFDFGAVTSDLNQEGLFARLQIQF